MRRCSPRSSTCWCPVAPGGPCHPVSGYRSRQPITGSCATNAIPATTWPFSDSPPPSAATSDSSASPHRTRSKHLAAGRVLRRARRKAFFGYAQFLNDNRRSGTAGTWDRVSDSQASEEVQGRPPTAPKHSIRPEDDAPLCPPLIFSAVRPEPSPASSRRPNSFNPRSRRCYPAPEACPSHNQVRPLPTTPR